MCCAPACEEIDGGIDAKLLNNCSPDFRACEENDGGLDAKLLNNCSQDYSSIGLDEKLLNNCSQDYSSIIKRNRSTSWTSPYLLN
jgi:hypothetical protein